MSSVPRAVPEATTWHYKSGPTRLCVVAEGFGPGDHTPCAAEAAVVLDLAGELLDALAAAGLAGTEPWQWMADVSGTVASGAQARWRGRHGTTDVEARVSLPWPLLRAMTDAPEVPGLQWQPTPAECLLAQWRLSDDERAALEPGGLLLLDGTPGERVRARGETSTGDLPLQLLARWEQPLPLDVVLGWSNTRPALPAVCQLVETARPERVLARGRLLPWGSGQALLVEVC